MQLVSERGAVDGAIIAGTYDPALVALSCLIAVFAAYVALRLIVQLRGARDRHLARVLMLTGALSLGGGIWSMHFVGMLAYQMEREMSYDGLLTLLSLAIAVLASFYGIYRIRQGRIRAAQLLLSGSVTGIGIAGMHYVGMEAMHAGAALYYLVDRFVISILIGVGAATAALSLGLTFSRRTPRLLGWQMMLSAAVMGLAICGMHYTGMAATLFVVDAAAGTETGFILDRGLVSYGVSLVLAIILCISLLLANADTRSSGKRRLGALLLLGTMVAVMIGGIVMVVLYDAAFKQQQARLIELARNEQRLIELAANFHAEYSKPEASGRDFEVGMNRIRDAHAGDSGFGRTGKINLGQLRDGRIRLLLPEKTVWTPAAPDPGFAEPMRRALAGQSGTMIARGDRGERMLAAYQPLADLELGVVSTIDLDEIRGPFIRAGLIAGGGAVLLICVGMAIAVGIGNPMLRQLEERERLEVELSVAKSVQAGLLPKAAPQHPRYSFAAETVPARFVGGDFYDFLQIDESSLVFIVGDVAGKGVAAALYMARLLGDFRYVCKLDPEPHRVLTRLNEMLSRDPHRGMFASAICALLDLDTGGLRLANAGHLPAALRRAGGAVEQHGAPSGPPLGVDADSEYGVQELTLDKGDSLLLLTDGVTEARNPYKQEFGRARVDAVLARHSGNAHELVKTLEAAFMDFTMQSPQFDDLTVLAVSAS